MPQSSSLSQSSLTSLQAQPQAEPSQPRQLTASQRTPPDLKWLLNERAALAGAQERSRERLEFFNRRLARVEAVAQRLQRMAAAEEQEARARAELLASFDTTISLAHPAADPQAAGVVRAWAGRYGERGGLKSYLMERLQTQSCSQNGLGEPAAGQSMTALIDAVIQDFELYIATPAERISLRMSVRTSLRNLRSDGLAECEMGTDHHGKPLTFWRWRRETSLDQLRALAEAVESDVVAGTAGSPAGQ